MSERAEPAESTFWGDADDAEALRRCRALVNAVDDGIYQLDPEGRFVGVNDVVVETTGYDRERLLGEHVSLLLDDADVRTFEREIERRLDGSADSPKSSGRAESTDSSKSSGNAESADRTETFEFGIRTADGDWIPCELRFNLLVEDGAFGGTVGVVRDVSEHERAERALEAHRERERELERYETLLTESQDVNAVLNPDGTFQFLPPSTENVLGYDPDDLLGEDAFQHVHPDDRERVWQLFAELVEDPESEPTTEFRYRHANDEWIVLETHARNLLDDPTIQGVVAYTRDVTERKRRERELERYETIVEAVDDGVYVVDEDGRFTMVNEAYAELTGYSREELLGEHASLVVDEDVRRRAQQAEATLRDGDGDADDIGDGDRPVVEAQLETASGERVPAEATFALFPDSDEHSRVGVVRDVSERKERERALAERERQLSTLMDNVPGMVYRCRNERDWPMEFVSDACREVTGYDPDAVERGDVNWGEDVMVEADRERLWENVQVAIEDGETFSTTYRIETADGDRRWVRDYGRGVTNEDGEVVAIEGIISDVTERKRLEAELDEVFGRVTDAFYALDDEWRITHANERAEQLVDYSGEGLVGRDFWEVFEWAADSKLGDEYRTAMATQESTSFEFYYPEPLEAWYEVHAYPSETGLSVYFRDVTERKERERELEESERRYRTLVEHFPNGAVALVDENLRYRTVGGSPVDETVPSAEELEGRPVAEALSPELADELVPALEAALDGESNTFEFEAELGDDGGFYQFRTVPVRDDDGDVFAALGMSQDITERTEYERKLAESERRYRTLAEYFPNGLVTLFDDDLRYTLAAGRGFDRIPVEPADLEGNYFREAWDADTADALEPAFEAALDGEERVIELEYAGREWVLHAVPITDDRGDVFAGMTMAQDVTEQVERERDLREAKSQLEAATEAGAVGTWEWHIPEDEFVTGASFARTFGVDPDRAREGVSLDQFVSAIHEDDRERVERKIERAVETCGDYEAEYRVRNADGEFRWVVARGHVECDDEGNPVTFPGALADITERKRAEQELEEHRKQLETLFEVLPVGVVVADADGRFVEANESAKELWGGDVFDAEDVAEYDRYPGWWADTGEPVDPDEWTMARVLRGEEVTEPDVYEIETTDGERRVVMAHGMPVREADGEVTRGVATLTDITERREYQRKLEESERRYRTLAENFPNGAVTVYDEDLRIELTQGSVLGETLPSRDQVEGRTVEDVYPEYIVDDLDPLLRAAVEEGKTGRSQFEFDGRVWRVWATPLRDAGGEIFAGLSFAQDITEQVEREQQLEETVAKLEESNERLESFASMLAHELRNPVTIGQIYSQQLPDEAAPDAVEYVTEAFDRIENMIDVMLVLTRGREAVGERAPLSVPDATREAWDDVDAPEASLETDLDAAMQADETYVRHLFRNLFENAVQHGGADVTVRVEELSDGFSVADDGAGIPPDHRDDVFETGFTTAGDEGGTGLGLAFVEKLAEVYDWTCSVHESESGGARFEFRNVDLDAPE